jgi:hypothetical protein
MFMKCCQMLSIAGHRKADTTFCENARGADRLNPLGPAATQGGYVAAVENTASSQGSAVGTRGATTAGK